jgi:hypothetical protein
MLGQKMELRQNVLKVYNFTTKGAQQQKNTCLNLGYNNSLDRLSGLAQEKKQIFPDVLVSAELANFGVNEFVGKKGVGALYRCGSGWCVEGLRSVRDPLTHQ